MLTVLRGGSEHLLFQGNVLLQGTVPGNGGEGTDGKRPAFRGEDGAASGRKDGTADDF